MRAQRGLSLLSTLLVTLIWSLFACEICRAQDLALVGAKIYPSPAGPAIEGGTVLVHDGRIAAVGPTATIQIPKNATVLNCRDLVVTAGFWNSHVHILPPGLLRAEKLSSVQITRQLDEMLTRWGFTTVFDIASVLKNTELIRQRIESGEVKGPRILTVGEPFWTKGGTPVYAKDFLEANHINIPDVESSAQAVARVRQQIHDGADGIKIFSGSIERGGILLMPLDVAKAIVSEAHREGKPVFAHPSNGKGIEIAIQSGVDVLAHPSTDGNPFTPELIQRMKTAHMALIPTLTLLDVEGKKGNEPPGNIEKWINMAVQEVKAYSEAGGQILFGTDVGYVDQFDTTEEFTLMSRTGMDFRQILASLTTNPAGRFGSATHAGRIAKGMDADLVVLRADPSLDAAAFAKVKYTIRGGKVIHSEP